MPTGPPGDTGAVSPWSRLHALLFRSFGLEVVFSVAVTATFILWVRQEWGGTWTTVVVTNVLSFAVPVGAALVCYLRARRSQGQLRTAWMLLGAACLSWAFGQGVWSAYEFSTGSPPPTPSWADVGFLGFVPFAAWGVAMMARRGDGRTGYARPLMDGAITAASFLYIALVFGLEDILLESRQGGFPIIVNAMYPFGDALVLGVVLLRLSRAPPAARRALVLLAVGMAALAVADLWFLVVDAQGAYSTGGILDAFWIIGFQLIGLAAVRPGNLERSLTTPHPTRSLALLPLAPFLLATVAAGYAHERDGGLADLLFWVALFNVLLLVTRLMVMLVDNVDLTDRAVRAAADLQREKGIRTRMMNAITHDMLNAMTPMRLQLHVLAKGQLGPLPDAQAHAVAVVERNAQQVIRLATDIKDGANVEEGRLSVDAAPTDLVSVARDAVAGRQAQAEAKQVKLELAAPEALGIQGDAGRLLQVLDNLISNALKFTPSGGLVRVEVANHDGAAHVNVIDSGRGLAADEVPRLFRPYSQVHAPEEVSERGTGLGLYISKGIIELHGGTISAVSAGRGQGASFSVTIPLGPGPASSGAEARR